MKKKSKSTASKVWYRQQGAFKYIWTYLCMVVLPVILFSLLFLSVQYQSIVGELQSKGFVHLEQVSAQFETDLSSFLTAVSHFSSIEQMPKPGTFEFESWIARQLKNYRVSLNIDGALYYYAHASDSIYTEDGCVHYSDFEKNGNFNNELNAVSFYTKINSQERPISFCSRDYNGIGRYFIGLYPVPYLNASSTGSIIFMISMEQYEQILDRVIGDFDGYFTVLDNEKNTAFIADHHNMVNHAAVMRALLPLSGNNLFHHEIQGEPFVTMRLSERNSGNTYMLSISSRVFYQHLRRMITLYSALCIGIVLVAVVICFRLAHKQFEPLWELTQFLSDAGEDDIEPSSDILEKIRFSYTVAHDQNRQLRLKVNTGIQEIRTKLIEGLANGLITNEADLNWMCSFSGVTFSYPDYFILLLRLNNASGRKGLASEAAGFISDVMLYDANAYAFLTDDSNRLGMIINARIDPAQTDIKQRQTEIMQMIFDTIHRLNLNVLSICASSLRNSPMQLNQCFLEALSVQEDLETFPPFFIYHGSISSASTSIEEEDLLSKALYYGNEAFANEVFSDMLGRVGRYYSVQTIRQPFYYMILHLLTNMARKKDIDEDFVIQLSAIPQDPLDDFEAKVRDAIHTLCVHTPQSSSNVANEDMRQKLIKYICEHFQDSTLSLTSIADTFNYSESFISKSIREITGTTFSSYVTGLRMEHVKRELTETQRPIREIIESAGYLDPSSFTRKFRNLEGITPGEYRARFSAFQSGNHNSSGQL